MPIHDWTLVTPGTWHAFHLSWIAEIQLALNGGLLPPDYYAQAEQIAGPMGPDVLALHSPELAQDEYADEAQAEGGVAVQVAPPKMRLVQEFELNEYARKRRNLVIRHASGDRIVALIEIVSPGNKSSQAALRAFVEKAWEALFQGFHLLIVDLFPPGPRDPKGIHVEIFAELGETAPPLTKEEPLTLAAYSAGQPKRAYVEPAAVGQVLIDMPLFLSPQRYVDVPLEATYTAAYRGVPRRWRTVLEGKGGANS